MKYLLVLMSLVLLGGCQAQKEQGAEVSQVTSLIASQFQVTLIVDGETVSEEKLDFEPGDNLLDRMKEHYSIKEKNGFVEAINQYEQDSSEMKYWLFEVNGQASQVGASQVELKEGDEVVWTLSVLN